MLSKSQHKNYRPLVKRAWRAHCAEIGGDPADKIAHERWYRVQLMEVGGWYTTKECAKPADYNRLMLHFATLCCDEAWLLYFATAEERGMKHMIARELIELSSLKNRRIGWSYARAIMRQMNLSEDINQVPARDLHKVYIALNTHHRRLLRARAATKH